MSKKHAHGPAGRPKPEAEAERWCRRALVVSERVARAEYYEEERRKERKDRRGYAWWRVNVHQRLRGQGR
jgi:hypothetical protein